MLDLDYLTNRLDFGKSLISFEKTSELKDFIHKAYRFSPLKYVYLAQYQSSLFKENYPLWIFIKKLKSIDEILENKSVPKLAD